MHPSRDELSGFVLGTLEDQVADQVADHIDHCPQCEETLRQIETASDTFIQTLKLPAVEIPHSGESGCRELVQVIQAIGREPSFTSAGIVAVATDQEDLGSLGHYRLLAKLGEGGMGTVYKALHTNLDRVVAIKVLPSDRMQNEDAVSRFQREMKAVGKLHHPNIVIAHDAGEVDGTHYLVMELVDGIDLSALVRRVGPVVVGQASSLPFNGCDVTWQAGSLPHLAMTVADACEMIRQAAVGLQEAHEDGMVHRDIKPSNLMLARSRKGRKPPLVKILDLGLALLDDQQGQRRDLTSTGQMMGTLDYMAPEQGGDSHEVDIRADIYALGATLYKLLCGHPPFAGERYNTQIKMIRALALESPPSIGEMRDDLSVELVAVVDRMLAKDPDDRFAEPEEVAQALAPFCEGFDLASLLKKATAEGAESTEDESTVATHESLKSGSVETAPTIDAPIESPLPVGEEPVGPVSRTGPDGFARTESIRQPARCATGSAGSASEEPRQPEPALAKPVAPVAPSKARSPKGEGRWYTSRRNQIIAAGLGGVILLAAILFYIKTDHGTIVVEIHDPSISVTVNGEDILISDPTATVDPASDKHKQAGQPIKLRPGEHTLHISYGDLEFDTEKFNLRRGDKVVLSVKVADGQVKVAQDDKVIGRKAILRANYALAFDGSGAYVDSANPDLLNVRSNKITIEALVNPTDQRISIVAGKSESGKNDYALTLFEGAPEFALYNGSSEVRIRGKQQIPINRWTHIAGSYNGVEAKIFVNGQIESYRPFTGNIAATSTKFMIGMRRNEPYPFNGSIDEVRISKVARYDKDFEPPKPGERFKPDEHTLALYHFDEGQGEIAHDSSGNHHHGKIVGAKWVRSSGEYGSSSSEDYGHPLHETTAPISGTALVAQPTKIDALESWTFETRDPRGDVRDVEHSPDGKLIAAASDDGAVRIWDSQTGKLMKALLGHDGGVYSVSWAPNSRQLASSSADKTVRIWDVAQGRTTRKLAGAFDLPVYRVAWSPDGEHIAAGAVKGEHIAIWDVATWKLATKIPVSGLLSLAWSPDSKRVASGVYIEASVFDVAATKRVAHLSTVGKDYSVRAVDLSWSSDGDKLAIAGADADNLIWSVTSSQPPLVIRRSDKYGVAWHPNGKSVVACGLNGAIDSWDVETGATTNRAQATLIARRAGAICISPDGQRLCLGSDSGGVEIFDATTWSSVMTLSRGHRNHVKDIAWSSLDQQFAVIDEAGGIRMLNAQSGALVDEVQMTPIGDGHHSLGWVPKHGRAIGSGDLFNGFFYSRAGSNGQLIPRPIEHRESHPAGLGAVDFVRSPDGNLLASREHTKPHIAITDVKNEQVLTHWMEEKRTRSLAWAPDSRTIAVGSENAVLLRSVPEGELIQTFDTGGSDIFAIAYSGDGVRLAVASGDGKIRLLDINSGELQSTFVGSNTTISNVAWLDDNRIVVGCSEEGALHYWDVATERLARTIEGVYPGTFSPDNRLLASHISSSAAGSYGYGREAAVRIREVNGGELTRTYLSLQDRQWISLSPGGNFTGSADILDEFIFVVQTESGQETLTPDEFTKKYGWKNDPEKVKLTD